MRASAVPGAFLPVPSGEWGGDSHQCRLPLPLYPARLAGIPCFEMGWGWTIMMEKATAVESLIEAIRRACNREVKM